MTPLGDFVVAIRSEALGLAAEHLGLVALSTAIAVAAGVPLGILAVRRPGLGRLVLGFANFVQTVPSLALFGFLIPLPWIGGIGASTAIVALVLYALLPIVRGTHAGLRGVDPAVREAALGMGMDARQMLFQVELPLAAPVILAGIRVATVISVGVATIAAAIGAGGLGVYIFRGVSMVDDRLILAGAIPAAAMALAADFGLGWLERRLTADPRRRTVPVSGAP
jgi:osmoprotectant transport system permease protein